MDEGPKDYKNFYKSKLLLTSQYQTSPTICTHCMYMHKLPKNNMKEQMRGDTVLWIHPLPPQRSLGSFSVVARARHFTCQNTWVLILKRTFKHLLESFEGYLGHQEIVLPFDLQCSQTLQLTPFTELSHTVNVNT
jgi:hypothetical protein